MKRVDNPEFSIFLIENILILRQLRQILATRSLCYDRAISDLIMLHCVVQHRVAVRLKDKAVIFLYLAVASCHIPAAACCETCFSNLRSFIPTSLTFLRFLLIATITTVAIMATDTTTATDIGAECLIGRILC